MIYDIIVWKYSELNWYCSYGHPHVVRSSFKTMRRWVDHCMIVNPDLVSCNIVIEDSDYNHVWPIYTLPSKIDRYLNKDLKICLWYWSRCWKVFDCCATQYQYYRLLDSLVVWCWLRVREVPGSIPSQGPRHTKDIIKMVPVVPLFSTEHSKGRYWLFLKN